MSTPFDRVPYISLRSYRKDGSAVDTPVWSAPLDGKLVVFTLGDSYKVKRVARNPRVQIAKCDVRGKLLGPWVDGECRQVDKGSELEKRAYEALTQKYGLTMRLGNFFSRLAGRMKKRVVLELALSTNTTTVS